MSDDSNALIDSCKGITKKPLTKNQRTKIEEYLDLPKFSRWVKIKNIVINESGMTLEHAWTHSDKMIEKLEAGHINKRMPSPFSLYRSIKYASKHVREK